MFSERILFQGRRVILDLKMACSHNFGTALRICFDILHIEPAKGCMMGIILMVFLKNFSFSANRPFLAQKWHIIITLDPAYRFF